MPYEKRTIKPVVIVAWTALMLVITAFVAWLTPPSSDMLQEEEPEIVTIAFYSPAAADAEALIKMLNDVGEKMIREAGAIGERGAPFRVQLKIFSEQIAMQETALKDHFTNRSREDDDELEFRLKSNFEKWQAAAIVYRSMLDAILALDTLDEKSIKDTDPHPLADFPYFSIRFDYRQTLTNLHDTVKTEEMNRVTEYYLKQVR